MDERYNNVSLLLYQVLDWIGASEEMRGIYRETAIIDEIMSTAHLGEVGGGTTFYSFGSCFEGTTTLGLNSDTDKLMCFDNRMVERICDALPGKVSHLMVTDETTKPGYVKLQVVYDRVAQTIYQRVATLDEETDHLGRICIRQSTRLWSMKIDSPFYEINGPASTWSSVNGDIFDSVLAFRIKMIPSFTRSWISRKRMYNWPHPEQIDHMKDCGCFVVGVNHPSSQNKHIEWRLSFSLQERFLMNSINPTQHKCYILLKMIKKDIIHKQVPKSISSYHLKTCLFYAIENTPCALWTRNKLLECLLTCMRLLLHWVKEHNCPNYFIPNENMFDKLEYTTLRRVQTVLEDMVDHWFRFVWSITCDNIGNILCDLLYGCGPGMVQIRNDCTTRHIAKIYMQCWNRIQFRLKSKFLLSRCKSSYGILSVLHELKGALTQTYAVREYTAEQTEIAITYISQYINLQTAQSLASIMLTIRDEGRMRTVFDKFMYYIAASKASSLLSPYLIVASYCLQSGRFDTCEKFLLECETSLMHHVVSVCDCRFTFRLDDAMKQFVQILHRKTLSLKQFTSTCITSCIRFLPCEANLVSQALHLEMYRSVNTPPQSRNVLFDYWFDSINVDFKVYMYFLQYVLYSKTNKPANKQDAIYNIARVINTDKTLGHRETACNLLGWIYFQENRKHKALKWFLISLRIWPIHNAAKWHVLLLLYHITRGS